MAKLQFSCPYCRAELQAHVSGEGKEVRCPGCQGVFRLAYRDGGETPIVPVRLGLETTSRKHPTLDDPGTDADGFDSGNSALRQQIADSLLAGNRVFVTGAAGTGKTYLLKSIAKEIAERKHVVHVTASTGIAASLLFGEIEGQGSFYLRGPSTLHAAAMLPRSSDPDEPRAIQVGINSLKDSEVIIIDEISTLDRLTFDRFLTRAPEGAGILVVGDFLQLPPVRSDENGEPDFAFRSPGFSSFEIAELTTKYRHSESEFIQFLERLRHGDNIRAFYQDIPTEFEPGYPVLFGTNREVDARNASEMAKIEQKSFWCSCHVEVGKPEKALKWFAGYTRAVQVLEIKQGMRVLCVQNIPAVGLVNGDLGTLQHVSSEDWQGHGPVLVDVEFDRVGIRRMRRYRFKKEKTTKHGRRKVMYAVYQFPLVPAYALTVHKAQGLTLDVVNIDGNRVNFAKGQVYVALSRCRRKSGLRINNSNMFQAFTRPSVEEYYRNANRFRLQAD